MKKVAKLQADLCLMWLGPPQSNLLVERRARRTTPVSHAITARRRGTSSLIAVKRSRMRQRRRRRRKGLPVAEANQLIAMFL